MPAGVAMTRAELLAELHALSSWMGAVGHNDTGPSGELRPHVARHTRKLIELLIAPATSTASASRSAACAWSRSCANLESIPDGPHDHREPLTLRAVAEDLAREAFREDLNPLDPYEPGER
jgi:hypothetical protein